MIETKETTDFFQQLEGRMQSLSPSIQLGLKRDGWFYALVVLGAVLTVAPLSLQFDVWGFWLTWGGLSLQLVGLALIAYRQIGDVLPELQDARKKFATELDDHFASRDLVLDWLLTLPSDVRKSRLAYVETRLETLKARFPVLFGPVDRLGVLPALVALYIQYQALRSVSGLAMILGLLIVALYLMSLWIIRYRSQLESYIRVLQAAERND